MNFNVLLEQINAIWAPLEMNLVIFVTGYLLISARRDGVRYRDFFDRNGPIHIQLAIAILTFHFADMGVRFVVWSWRYHMSRHEELAWYISGPILLGFAVLAVIGLLCTIRVITNAWCKNWAWLFALAVALLFDLVVSWDEIWATIN